MRFAVLVTIALSAGLMFFLWPAAAGAMEPEKLSSAVRLLSQERHDNEPDILLMALLTVAVAAGAAVLSLIGYVIRQRVGFWLHRPPPRESNPPEEHH